MECKNPTRSCSWVDAFPMRRKVKANRFRSTIFKLLASVNRPSWDNLDCRFLEEMKAEFSLQ